MQLTKKQKDILQEAVWELELGYTSYIPRRMKTKREEEISGQGYKHGIESAIKMLKEMQKEEFVPFRLLAFLPQLKQGVSSEVS